MKKLLSVTDVVSAFGGPDACAVWAGVGVSAVNGWMAAGCIPAGWHHRLFTELGSRGFVIDTRIFTHPDPLGLPGREIGEPSAPEDATDAEA